MRLVLFGSVIGIIYSLATIFMTLSAYQAAEEKYAALSEIYHAANHEAGTDNHEELRKMNDDYIGWLSVDGTEIDYPIVQSITNEFYLNHNFYQEEDRVGAIYLDYRNHSSDINQHTIIYGHNMKNDSMFGTLKNVLNDDFQKGNRIRLITPDHTYEWEIFSAYQTRNTDWMQVNFPTESDSTSFMNTITEKTMNTFPETTLDQTDNIITLATCTGRFSDERTIVHAKLVKGN